MTYIGNTKKWLENLVIGLNLCPFAKSVYVKNEIRFAVSEADSHDDLVQDLLNELLFLSSAEGDEIETTLLIVPFLLNDFEEYLDFLDFAEELLEEAGLEGQLQIASFHPDYQFEDTDPDDAENYTNRSPYPMFHLLRESSVERAVESYPDDVEEIPNRNIEKMRALGLEKILSLLQMP